MRTIAMAVFLSALLVAGGCSDTKTSTSTTTPASTNDSSSAPAQLTAEQLGELGAAITKNPNDAQSLLTQKGLNETSFEQAVRKVAENPEESKRYAEAYKRASA
jgi:hypothetical protein